MAVESPSNYKRLPGKAQRFRNIETGEEISRREFNKRTGRLSFEELAKANKAANEDAQLLRPARGRSSARNAPEEIKKVVLEARKVITDAEKEERRKAREKALREAEKKKELAAELRKQKRIERERTKLYRREIPKLSRLKPGSLGFKVRFTSFADYEKMMRELRAIGRDKILGYTLGWVFIDERTGKKGAMTLTPMLKGISERDDLDEEEFSEMFDTSIEEKTYAVFLYYFAHIAVTKAWAKKWAQDNGKHWKDK